MIIMQIWCYISLKLCTIYLQRGWEIEESSSSIGPESDEDAGGGVGVSVGKRVGNTVGEVLPESVVVNCNNCLVCCE